ncbi:MAG: DNA polymerase III subunit beta [Oscillospiraceae bacterium]|nr:DNA polymerase III subunit beta [Oscillospiraceae bacterium]
MKFTCEKYLLSMAVATAGRAAAAKSPIPALEGLLVEAGANVRITGYDLKKGIYTNFDADVSVPGSVVLSAKLFGDIVRKLPDGIVTVSSDEYNAVNIKCGNADYNISGNPADDYPELPSMDYASAIVLPQDAFSRMIAQTGFAISTNESRPVYTGALLEVENNTLTMVAVDGYRLALRRESVEKCDVDAIRFIVPGAALSDMEKICTSTEEPVTITVGSKHISFSVGDTVLISRRLEGEFLNYKKTVPYDFPIRVKAARADMIRCADRVSLIIDDRSKNPLRCCFGDGQLSITCATPLGRAEDVCPIDGNGDNLIIGFNNSYLLDALKAAPAEVLQVNLGNGSSPCVLTPEDGSDKFLYMILPVRLRAGE